jgi:hypothetical protein
MENGFSTDKAIIFLKPFPLKFHEKKSCKKRVKIHLESSEDRF